jgi:ribokinase
VGPEGEEGCPAFRVRAVDTVAAGDAFTAAFALHYRHASLIEALRFACAAGALATTRPGATPSLPSRAEVEGLLAAQPA